MNTGLSRTSVLLGCLLALGGAIHPAGVAAQPGNPAVATCTDVAGALFCREDKGWHALKSGDKVPADRLLLSLFKADFKSANDAVKVTLIGDVGLHGQFPVLETAARLGQHAGSDLAVTLERGIVVLENAKKKGDAKVHLVIRGEPVEVVLHGAETRLGIEVYGRHAPGSASIKADDPVTFVLMLAIQGHATLSHKDESVGLRAPPGPALLRWDSLDKQVEVDTLQKLPMDVEAKAAWEKSMASLCGCAKSLAGSDRKEALIKLVKASDKMDRLVGVTALGALDDLGGVADVLSTSKHADAREQAILVLRHWLGREPGQIKKLHAYLTTERKLKPAAAKNLVLLLLGFDHKHLEEPQTYDLLVESLNSPHLAVRSLAHWQLVRLVPAGKEIPYDAAASADERRAAFQRWRDLIPPGKLPTDPKKSDKN